MLSRQPFSVKGGYSLVDWENGQRDIVPNSEADRIEREEKKAAEAISSPQDQWAEVLKKLEDHPDTRTAQLQLTQPQIGMRTDAGGTGPSMAPLLPTQEQKDAMGVNQVAGQLSAPAQQPSRQAGTTPATGPLSPSQLANLQASALGNQTELGPAGLVIDAFNRPVWRPGAPGRPGYNETDAAKKFREKMSVSEGRVGPDLTEEDKQQILSDTLTAEQLREQAQQKQNEIDMAEAASNYQLSQAKTQELTQIHAARQEQQRATELEYSALQEQTLREVRESANEEVDQGRLFDNKNAFARFAMILSIAASSYASKGTDSGIVMQFIKNDIDSQQARINNRRKNADNALTRLSQRFGSVEAGRKALEASQLELATQRFREMGAKFGTERARLVAEKATAETMARTQDALNEVRQSFIGKRSIETADRFRDPIAPVAGTPGRFGPPTVQEALALLNGYADVKNKFLQAGKTEAEANKLAAEAVQAQEGGGISPEASARLIESHSKEFAALVSGEMEYKAALEAMRLKETRDGRLEGDVPGYYGSNVAGKILKEGTPTIRSDSKAVDTAVRVLMERATTAMTGAVAAPDQKETMLQEIIQDGSEEGLKRGMASVGRKLKERRAALEAGLVQPLLRQYQGNLEASRKALYSPPSSEGTPATNPLLRK